MATGHRTSASSRDRASSAIRSRGRPVSPDRGSTSPETLAGTQRRPGRASTPRTPLDSHPAAAGAQGAVERLEATARPGTRLRP